jgi:hypothetical protein
VNLCSVFYAELCLLIVIAEFDCEKSQPHKRLTPERHFKKIREAVQYGERQRPADASRNVPEIAAHAITICSISHSPFPFPAFLI